MVLIFWGIARSYVTSNLRHEASADVETSQVELLAESAVAEVEARIGWAVNALEGPVAELVRRPVLAGERGDLDLTPYVTLPETTALLETPGYRGYTLHEWSARVVSQRQVDAVPTEKRALFEFTATCSSPGLVRKVSRRLELARWAKITLTTVPRPFGNYGIFFLNATGLTDVEAVNRHRTRALALVREVRAKLAPAGTPAVQELLAQSFDPDGPAGAPPELVLPDSAALYGLAEFRGPQRLKALDLARTMSEQVDRAERAAAAVPSGGDPALLEAAGRAALTAAISPLLELWNFHRNFAVLASGAGPEWADLTAVTWKLREDFYQRRAHYRLEEGPGLPPVQAQLKRLLDDRASGVIDCNNRTPLQLTGEIHGRVVLLIGPGGADIRSVNASETATGQVTIVTASGPLRIAGVNGASVILADPPDGRGLGAITMDRDARLRGSFIATNVPSGGLPDGEVERDDRTFSGLTEPDGKEVLLADRCWVGLSPRTLYKRLVRP